MSTKNLKDNTFQIKNKYIRLNEIMKASFHSSSLIAKEEMKILITRSNNPALVRFFLMYSFFIAMNFIVVLSWNQSIFLVILTQLIYAIICCSTFAALHETAHGTAFKSKRLNKIAALLTGFAHIYPSSVFKALHFTHHRFTHIPGKDPEISIGNKPIPSYLLNVSTYFSWLSGLPLLMFKIIMIISGALGMPEFLRKALFPFVNPKKRGGIFIECIVSLCLYGSLIFYALTEDSRLIAILVGQIVGHALLAFYLSMEHQGLAHEGNILEKTRSINANKFVKYVMWNMPYHAEHHAFPAVPFHTLPELHKRLGSEIKHKDESHLSFHLNNLSKLIKK